MKVLLAKTGERFEDSKPAQAVVQRSTHTCPVYVALRAAQNSYKASA